IAEPDAASLLMEVDYHAGLRGLDALDGFLELLAAVASRRFEHIAGEAFGMEPHQGWPPASDIALDKGQMLATIDDVAEDDRLEVTVIARERHARHALDEDLVGQAM